MLAEAIAIKFSWPILALLMLMLLAASAVFSILIRRETIGRRWAALSDWSRNHAAAIQRPPAALLPVPLSFLLPLRPLVRYLIEAENWSIVEILLDAPPQSSVPIGPRRVFLRRLDADWPPTALRPVTHLSSLVDLLSLTSFPSLSSGGRFVIFGSAATAAKALAQSSTEALLPPDVGLILSHNFMMLDFSPRPFDTIEFGRMLALSDQLSQHLPKVTVTVAQT
jgi:hypothetical protein